MVGSHNNQSLFRVLLVELISHFYRIIQIDNFLKNGGRVIAVASPVYLTSFHHKEESFIVSLCQERNSTFGNLRQGKVTFLAVDGIRQAGRYGALFLDKYHFPCIRSLCFVFVQSSGNGISRFLYNGEDTRCIFLIGCRSGFQETAACVKVETGLRQVKRNFVIHATVGLVGIECRRGSVVYTDTGGDTDFPACFLGFLGNCLQGIFIIVHTNSPIVCLCTGSKCRTGC